MAKINGIEIKNTTKFKGHEGEPLYQGNLYLNGKKIAFWSQDSRGSMCDNIDMEKGFSEERLRKQIVSLNEDKAIHGISVNGNNYTVEYDIEELMYDLLNLKDDEKFFKKSIKDGYAGIIVLENDVCNKVFYLMKVMANKSRDEIAKTPYVKTAIEKMTRGKDTPKMTIYKKAEDFNIGKPIDLSTILY